MINSIYTHKEIFLREIISNASDALDKLYYRSLTDDSVTLSRGDFEIRIDCDRAVRTVTISDNGCGIPERDIARITRPGFTTGGHGYGLSLVEKYARMLGGCVYIDSKEASGSVFTVHIPVRAEKISVSPCIPPFHSA